MIRIQFNKNLLNGSFDIYIIDCDENKQEYKICKPLEMEFINQDIGEQLQPTISLGIVEGEKFIEDLLNSMIEQGYYDKRLNKDREIKRIENHLEDMRTLVFKKGT